MARAIGNYAVWRLIMKRTMVAIALVFALGCSLLWYATPALAETIELKFATGFSPKHTMQTQVFEPWAKKISELTKGKVKVTFYPGGALSKAPETYAIVEKGIADLGYFLHDYTPGRFPLTTVFELPFMVPNSTKLSSAMWKTYETIPAFQKEYRKVKPMALFGHPGGHFCTTKKPIKTIDDFKGLKIRTVSPSVTEALKIFGAAPVSMPITETYAALERGVVDGTVVPWEGIVIFKLDDLIKYVTVADFYTVTMAVVMNKAKYESLPADVKKVIDENSGMSLSLACGKAYDDTDAPMKKKCVDRGIEVLKFSDADMQKLKDLTMPLRTKWVKDMKAKSLPGKETLETALKNLK
jgi:TRAP-type C4-dicarboxylate transport system substrate-binding protein